MKSAVRFLAAVALPLAVMMPVQADEALAKAKGCTACHAVDKKMVGPSYAQVAGCYKGKDKDKVIKHIKAGGAGVWGPVPMPAHPQVSDADIAKIVDWVYSLKPAECPKEFKGHK